VRSPRPTDKQTCLSLVHADRLRGDLVAWAHGVGLAGFLILTTTCSAATAIASLLVRRYSPFSSGSGITHVEAVLARRIGPGALSPYPP
jgi:CIC family chloride channel protein